MSKRTASAALSYALSGAALGILVPAGATGLRVWQGMDPVALHRSDPLFWILDGVPLLLALFAFIAGARHDRAADANAVLAERAADFDAAANALEVTMRHAAHHSEELIRVRAELDRLAKVASHDLAAPLVGIRNLAEWVREEIDPETTGNALQHLDKLEQRIERMQRLVRRVEEFASAGRTRQGAESVDVKQLVQNTFQRTHGSVRFTILVGDLPELFTARRPLATVFRALIENAVAHHDMAEGTIIVSAKQLSPRMEFRVRDDGPGIPERYRKRVFDLFETLERRDLKEAAGAGLAIAKKIVEAHGCTIEVAPRDGRGTEMVFTWPLSLDDEPSEMNTVIRQSIVSVLHKRKTAAEKSE